MDNAKIIIAKTEDFVKQSLANHDGSHDTQHIWRVRQTALDLAREEGADLFVVELAALLHDIGDYKYNPGGDQVALVSDYLKRVGVDAKVIDQVTSIIDHMGFKSSLEKKSPPPATPEFACVQDADRLDAIGAIGIARCIAYGGSRKGAIYVPGASANAGRKLTAKEYGSTSSDAVTHFYDKLLKVRDRMGTVSGTREASHRHDVMINFLRDLGKEVGEDLVSMYEVPVIDLSGDPAVVAQQLYKACTTWGAFVATNHGIDESIMNRVVNESRKFFELPEEEKEKLHIRNGIAWRGYMPNGGEKTHGSTDNKEGLYVGPEHGPDHTRVKSSTPLYGPNQFPDAVLPNLRPAVLSYIEAGTGLGQRIMDLLSLSLGLSEDHIRAKFTPDPIALVRLFRYTPARSTSSFGDHSDYGLWTLLLHTQPGLQFYNEKLGVWGTVPAIPGSIVCNVGDVLDRMTGGRFISPRHRVLNLTGSTWLSIPFVFDPSWDAIMGPLPLDNLPELSEDDKTAAMARWDTTSIVSLEEPYSAFLAKKVSEGFHQDRASQ